jgi:hypothetical protein
MLLKNLSFYVRSLSLENEEQDFSKNVFQEIHQLLILLFDYVIMLDIFPYYFILSNEFNKTSIEEVQYSD